MSDEKNEMSIEKVDVAITTTEHVFSPAEVQARFPLLQDLNDEEMATLNKRLLSRIDWRLMPTITIMFLMKYVSFIFTSISSNFGCPATSTASTYPMHDSQAFSQTSTCRIQYGAPEPQPSTLDTSSDNCQETCGWLKFDRACSFLG